MTVRKIDGIEVKYVESKREFSNVWCEFGSSTQTLPKGWRRESGRRALPEAIVWEKDVAIPLRDGTNLRADVFRPAKQQGKPIPALLPWSPYGKTGTGPQLTTNFEFLGVSKSSLSGLEKFEAPDPAEWCSRGYAIVNVDSRGAFKSEGDLVVFGTQEGKDGYDTIEWIAKQGWCNGSVALVGNSWLGISQWFTAAEQPPHLKAIAPWEGLGDFYRETLCRGGIPNPLFWDRLAQSLEGEHLREDIIGMLEKYPHMNAYWEDKKPQIQSIKVPMYAVASYSSCLHTEGSIRGWKYSNSTEKWLRVHPTQEWFDIYSSEASDDLQRFLDCYLLGKNNGWEFTPKVRISLLRYNAPPIINRVEDNYPPSRTKYETFYLDCEQGKLTHSLPTMTSHMSYQSDSWADDGSHFVYTFANHTELCGFSKVKLYMSCDDLDDLDVYVIIRKLDNCGKSLIHYNIPFINQKPGTQPEDIPKINVYQYVGPNGRLRASKRETAEEPNLTPEMKAKRDPTELWYPYYKTARVPKGEIVELDIAIWPGGMVFEAGESMRLEVKGHDPVMPEQPEMYQRFVNQNVGRHKVYSGTNYPSGHIISSPTIQGSHTVFLITNFWQTTNKAIEVNQGKAVTDICKEAGAQHLIFSSLRGLFELTGGRLRNVAYFDSKAEIENYICQSSVPATFVLAAFFMTNFWEALKKRGDVLTLEWPVDPDKAKVPVLDVNEDTGKFVKAVIKKFPATVGKRVLVAEGYYTPKQIVAEIAETVGIKTAAVKIAPEEFTSFLAPELTQGTIENLQVMEAEGYYGGESLEPSLALLEEKPVSWKEFFQRNASLFV